MVATSHDVMPDIELYQPTDEENALALANTLGSDGWLLAGGQDTFGWLKDRNKAPSAMIELTQIDAWKGIRETADGVEIGAVTTLTEIANNPIIQDRYGVLAQAAGIVDGRRRLQCDLFARVGQPQHLVAEPMESWVANYSVAISPFEFQSEIFPLLIVKNFSTA